MNTKTSLNDQDISHLDAKIWIYGMPVISSVPRLENFGKWTVYRE